MPFRLLGYGDGFFSGLKELIVVVEENDEGELIRRDISVAPKFIQEQIKDYKQESPDIKFPVVKVMMEAMLVNYVNRPTQTLISSGSLSALR